MLKAVWFDMDGTLLDINLSAFVYTFVKDQSMILAAIARRNLFSASAQWCSAFLSMFDACRDDDLTNRAWFDAELERRSGVPVTDPVIAEAFGFYEREVLPRRNNRVVAARARTGAHEAVEKVAAGGYRCSLITNPSFSQASIECRMGWSGLLDAPFERVTYMENSTRCKPDARYYRENLAALGLAPDEVLMVGNDPKRDFPEPDIGIRTAYVGAGAPERALWSGSMADFACDFEQVVELFEADVERCRAEEGRDDEGRAGEKDAR